MFHVRSCWVVLGEPLDDGHGLTGRVVVSGVGAVLAEQLHGGESLDIVLVAQVLLDGAVHLHAHQRQQTDPTRGFVLAKMSHLDKLVVASLGSQRIGGLLVLRSQSLAVAAPCEDRNVSAGDAMACNQAGVHTWGIELNEGQGLGANDLIEVGFSLHRHSE